MLRQYQLDAIDGVRREARNGKRAICLVMPTGAGKTRTCGEIVRLSVSKGRSALWLAHRGELVDQAVGALAAMGVRSGALSASAASEPQPHLPVQVATVQTLLARGLRPTADLIVADEAHHYVAAEFRKVIDDYQRALVIGPTATPERGDGKGLGEMFDALVVGTTTRELVELGHLVPSHLIRPSRKLRSGEIAQRPVDAYMAHARGRRTICFSSLVAEAEKHRDEFREAGFRATLVTGTTPWDERREAFKALGEGRLDVLCNVYVATEGFDVPSIDCVILARGIGSSGGYLQMVGRALRTSPDTGKQDAIILDLTGTSHVHGHPEDDRTYSLEGRGITLGGGASADQTYCKVCGAPTQPGQPCPDCGASSARNSQRVINAALERYANKRAEAPDKRIATLSRWINEGRIKGHKPSWAMVKYKAVYGDWPPNDIRSAASIVAGGQRPLL